MKKKVLITGGYGLIGSKIANSLPDDVEVYIVSRSPDKYGRLKRKENTYFLLTDINDLKISELEGVDVIYHCASTVDNYHILSNREIDIETNLKGTNHLLDLISQLDKKPKLIYLSTFFVYGNTYEKKMLPINEESKTDPLALYPATKLCAEQFIKCYARLYKFDYLICRLSNVYGEDESLGVKKAALNMLIKKACDKEEIPIYNNGMFYRDYIYVDDVVEALLFLEEKAKNETFLVAFGERVLFRDMISFIVEKTGCTTKAIEPPDFHNVVGIRSFVADTSKINKLGWKAKIDYKEGLSRIIRKYLYE